MAFGDEDLDAIFSSSDPFAVLAVFQIDVSTQVSVYGQFTAGTDETMLYGVAVEGQNPSIICRSSEITAVRPKMTVTISTVAYTVQRIEKSGAPGVATVYLKT
jgi:hypothetical protein